MNGPNKSRLAANLANVRARIGAACARAKRDPRDVTLVAVTKSVGPELTEQLLELGVTDIGENRLQAAQDKFPLIPALQLRKKVTRHFIGHLQTNKVRPVLEMFDVIHSVDTVKLAEEISKRSVQAQKEISCFLELNVSGEDSKEGMPPQEANAALEHLAKLPHIRWLGLMTMAPLGAKVELVRRVFRDLRECAGQASSTGLLPRPASLSMGMSNDFEIAIEEGATHVRVGTALFEGLHT